MAADDPSSSARDSGESGLAACACFNARSAARAITDLYDDALATSGLRTTQFAILATIHLRAGITMQELAGQLDLDPSTMTRTLRPLEQDGLVRIETASDRRAKSLVLTSAGRHKLGECHALWNGAQTELRARLGSEVFNRVVADMNTVTQALRE